MSALVHMISDTFGFWIGIVGDAAGTPAAWNSPVLDADEWCYGCAPKPAADDSPPGGYSDAV